MSKKYEEYIFGKKHLILTAISVGTTLLMILIFGGLGYLIDLKLNSKPLGTILGILLSYPVTQIVVLSRIRKLLKK